MAPAGFASVTAHDIADPPGAVIVNRDMADGVDGA